MNMTMDSSNNNLVEVWGDTVNFKSMLFAIVIGSVVSTGTFLLAKFFLSSSSGDTTLLNGYAMLIGLGGCLLSGFICSIMFKPARTVISSQEDNSDNVKAFIVDLIKDDPNYTSVNDLPSEVKEELNLLQLMTVFQEAEEIAKKKQ
jgi:ABC-type transport system involved in multi-copper enzyme maturation permease subunit